MLASKRDPNYAAGIVQLWSLIIGLSHPLIASELRCLAETALDTDLPLEVIGYAATAPAPYMRSFVAFAHGRSTFHLQPPQGEM